MEETTLDKLKQDTIKRFFNGSMFGEDDRFAYESGINDFIRVLLRETESDNRQD